MKKCLPIIIAILLISPIACSKNKAKKTEDKKEETKKEEIKKEISMTETTSKFTEPKEANVDKTKKYTAIIKTAKGNIVCELYPKEAPLSVTNFVQLANGGFYNGLTFHRVVADFVIQGGDPLGTGTGGPGYTIPAEIKLQHKQGALAWARTGDEINPEKRSSGSQFYITLKATPFLDGAYTVFGQTIEGMDIVEKIAVGDKIESIEVKVE